jgi:hypothetical protein
VTLHPDVALERRAGERCWERERRRRCVALQGGWVLEGCGTGGLEVGEEGLHVFEAGFCDFEGVFLPELGVKEFEGYPLIVSFFDEDAEFGGEIDLAFTDHDAVGIFLLA